MAENITWLTRQTELSKLIFPLTIKFMSGVDLSEESIVSSSSVYNLHGKGEIMKALGYDCLGNAFTIPMECNQKLSIKMMHESRLFPTVQEICELKFTPHYITNELQFDIYTVSFPKYTVFKVLLVCVDNERGMMGLSVESLGPHPVRMLLPCHSRGNFKEYMLPCDKYQTYVISQLKSIRLPLFVEFIKPVNSDTDAQYRPAGICRIDEIKKCSVVYASTIIDKIPYVMAIECAKFIKIRFFQSTMAPKVEQIELDQIEWYFNHICCKGKTSFAPYAQIVTKEDQKTGCKLHIKGELKSLKNIYSPDPSSERKSQNESIPATGHYSQIMQKGDAIQSQLTSSRESMPSHRDINSAVTSILCGRAVDSEKAPPPLPPKRHGTLKQYGSTAKDEEPLEIRSSQDSECKDKIGDVAFECKQDCSTVERFFSKKCEMNKQSLLSKELHLADSLSEMSAQATKEEHTSMKDRPVPSIRKKIAPPLPPRKDLSLKQHSKQESKKASFGKRHVRCLEKTGDTTFEFEKHCNKEETLFRKKYEGNERDLLSKELHLLDSSNETCVEVSKKEDTSQRARPVPTIRKKVAPPLPPRKRPSLKLQSSQASRVASFGKKCIEERCLEKTGESTSETGEHFIKNERLCSKKCDVNEGNLLLNELHLVDSSNDTNVELTKKEDTMKIVRPVPAMRKRSNKASCVDVGSLYSVAQKDCKKPLGSEVKEELQGNPILRTEDKKVEDIMQSSADFEERLDSSHNDHHVTSCTPQILNKTLEKRKENSKDSGLSRAVNSVGVSAAGSMYSLSSFLSKLNLEKYTKKMFEEQVDMKLLVGLKEVDLIDGIGMKKFEARKALLNAIHGWCWSEIDTCISDNPRSLWGLNEVVKRICEDIRMPEFAEFCAINKVDGKLLVNIVDKELIQSLRDEYDMKISKIEEVKLRKFVLQSWTP